MTPITGAVTSTNISSEFFAVSVSLTFLAVASILYVPPFVSVNWFVAVTSCIISGRSHAERWMQFDRRSKQVWSWQKHCERFEKMRSGESEVPEKDFAQSAAPRRTERWELLYFRVDIYKS